MEDWMKLFIIALAIITYATGGIIVYRKLPPARISATGQKITCAFWLPIAIITVIGNMLPKASKA